MAGMGRNLSAIRFPSSGRYNLLAIVDSQKISRISNDIDTPKKTGKLNIVNPYESLIITYIMSDLDRASF